MRTRHLLLVVVALGLAACRGISRRFDWAGRYVTVARSEYSVAEDTLTVSLVKNGEYSVLRSTGYRAVRGRVLLPKRLKRERFGMVLNASGDELSEPLNGRVYLLDSSGSLLVGTAVYRRIN